MFSLGVHTQGFLIGCLIYFRFYGLLFVSNWLATKSINTALLILAIFFLPLDQTESEQHNNFSSSRLQYFFVAVF